MDLLMIHDLAAARMCMVCQRERERKEREGRGEGERERERDKRREKKVTHRAKRQISHFRPTHQLPEEEGIRTASVPEVQFHIWRATGSWYFPASSLLKSAPSSTVDVRMCRARLEPDQDQFLIPHFPPLRIP